MCLRPRQTTVFLPLSLSSTGAAIVSVCLSILHAPFFDADTKQSTRTIIYSPWEVFRKEWSLYLNYPRCLKEGREKKLKLMQG
ncbi:hypothetical protein GGI42DRAFT_334937 [Trichoderma sp. SZMC 28013]